MHGGDWASMGAALYTEPEGLLDLSSSISPYGPGPRARMCWPGLVDRIDRYPDWRCGALTALMARHLGIGPGNVLMTSGGVEAIDLILQYFRPSRVFVKAPAFSEYQNRAVVRGIAVRFIADIREVQGQSGLMFLANPANPTGELMDRHTLAPYLAWAKSPGTTLVVDEAFIEFVENWREFTMSLEAVSHGGLLVIGSLTKFYGLAGARIGYVAGDAGIMAKVSAYAVPWHVSLVAQEMASACLQDQQYFEMARRLLHKERRRLAENLQPFGEVWGCPAANYLLMAPAMAVETFVEELRNRGILVRDTRDFIGLNKPLVRIAVKRPADSDRLIARLQEIYFEEGAE